MTVADLPRKVNEYFVSGSQQVWLLEPEPQHLTIYRSLSDSRRYGPEDEFDGGPLLPGFRCHVRELFDIE